MEVGEEGDQYFTSSAVHSARHGQVLHFRWAADSLMPESHF